MALPERDVKDLVVSDLHPRGTKELKGTLKPIGLLRDYDSPDGRRTSPDMLQGHLKETVLDLQLGLSSTSTASSGQDWFTTLLGGPRSPLVVRTSSNIEKALTYGIQHLKGNLDLLAPNSELGQSAFGNCVPTPVSDEVSDYIGDLLKTPPRTTGSLVNLPTVSHLELPVGASQKTSSKTQSPSQPFATPSLRHQFGLRLATDHPEIVLPSTATGGGDHPNHPTTKCPCGANLKTGVCKGGSNLGRAYLSCELKKACPLNSRQRTSLEPSDQNILCQHFRWLGPAPARSGPNLTSTRTPRDATASSNPTLGASTPPRPLRPCEGLRVSPNPSPQASQPPRPPEAPTEIFLCSGRGCNFLSAYSATEGKDQRKFSKLYCSERCWVEEKDRVARYSGAPLAIPYIPPDSVPSTESTSPDVGSPPPRRDTASQPNRPVDEPG